MPNLDGEEYPDVRNIGGEIEVIAEFLGSRIVRHSINDYREEFPDTSTIPRRLTRAGVEAVRALKEPGSPTYIESRILLGSELPQTESGWDEFVQDQEAA